MQAIYKPKQYPPQVLAKLRLMPQLAVEIANRWALGWPKRVAELIVYSSDADTYFQRL